jgi:hypothetical protein
MVGKATGIGIALVVGAFFFVNLVPFPHQTSASPGTENVLNSIQAHQLSLFGFNTPSIPSWAFTTSNLVLILATASFMFDAAFTIKDHL